jgi:hypothetical protein
LQTQIVAAISPKPDKEARPHCSSTPTGQRDVPRSMKFDFASPPWSYRYGFISRGKTRHLRRKNVWLACWRTPYAPRMQRVSRNHAAGGSGNNSAEFTYQAEALRLQCCFDRTRVDGAFLKTSSRTDSKRNSLRLTPTELRPASRNHLDQLIRSGRVRLAISAKRGIGESSARSIGLTHAGAARIQSALKLA